MRRIERNVRLRANLLALRDLTRTIFASRGGVAASAHTVLANIFLLCFYVGTGIITARVLGPSGRGEQAAIVVWPQAVAYTLTLGLPSALLYNLKRFPAQAAQLFPAALLLGTMMGLLATIAGVIFIPLWLNEYPPEAVRLAQWLMLLAPLVLLHLMFIAALQAREEFSLYNASRYFVPFAALLAVALLALVQSLTPLSASLAYLLPEVPIFLWLLIRLWRSYHPVWQGLSTAFKRLTSYGLRSYGVDVLALAVPLLDRALVAGLLAPSIMGLYVVAVSTARILDVFQSAAVSVLFPKASGRPVEEVLTLTGRAAKASTTLTAVAAIGLALLGPWAISLVYGKEFLGAVAVFRILLMELVLAGTIWVLAQAFMAIGKPGIVTVLQVIGVGLTIPLLLVMVPRYGLEGAGLAILIPTAVRFVLVLLSFPLILKVRPPRFWPKYADLRELFSKK